MINDVVVLGIKKMAVTVFYKEELYDLPESLRDLCEYQNGECTYIPPTLSHLKLIQISTEENPDLRYKLFVGVMPTKYDTIIIIYGEYFENHPYQYGLFHYIEVPKSELFEFDEQSSNFILDVENNSCAILLKREVIVIGITPDFYGHLENYEFDKCNELEYLKPYLSILRIDFIQKITELLFVGPPSIDKKMTLSVKKCDGICEICLCFPFVCCDSSDKIQSETTHKIFIDVSHCEIEILYVMNRITARHVVDSDFMDSHNTRTHEENDILYLKITYDRFPEEDD